MEACGPGGARITGANPLFVRLRCVARWSELWMQMREGGSE